MLIKRRNSSACSPTECVVCCINHNAGWKNIFTFQICSFSKAALFKGSFTEFRQWRRCGMTQRDKLTCGIHAWTFCARLDEQSKYFWNKHLKKNYFNLVSIQKTQYRHARIPNDPKTEFNMWVVTQGCLWLNALELLAHLRFLFVLRINTNQAG